MRNFLKSIIQDEISQILLIMFILLAIGYFVIYRLKTERDRKLELVIMFPAALTVILVGYNLILSTQSNDRIEQNRIANMTIENIQRNWLSPQVELTKYFPESYFLYKSMTPDSSYGQFEPLNYDHAKRDQIEVVYSFRVFQAIEDFLTIGSYDLTGKYVWINNFLMWMQSPILQKNWNLISFNFSKDTRKLINQLIVESNKLIVKRNELKRLTNKDYDSISENFDVPFRITLNSQ